MEDKRPEAMAYYCWKCQNEVVFEVRYGIKVGRQDTCPHCHSDLHCCKNCRLYEPSIHNQCREPEAPFIRDRDAGNFCAHFDIADRAEPPRVDDSATQARAKLNGLFRK